MSLEPQLAPPDSGKILIVGGYGKVGRSIAERLAPPLPGRVAISGRSLSKAQAVAGEIGHGVEGRAIDIQAASSADALDGVVLVIVCIDQTDTRFARQCLARAIHYIDISADYGFLSQVEKLDALARQNSVTALLSVGVAPGLTNLLAARAGARMARIERIDILLELGLGDHHGQAAVEWMLDNLDTEYEVKENGRSKTVRSFGEKINICLPGQNPARPAYRFSFPDQQVIGQTTDVPTVSTWVRFDSRLSTWIFAKSSRAGVGRLLRRPWWRKITVWLLTNVHLGSDICAVAVRATGQTMDGKPTLTLGLIGRCEALMTAVVAAQAAHQLLSKSLPPGVRHAGQALALDPIVDALQQELPDLTVVLAA